MPRRALLVIVAIVACILVGLFWLWPAATPTLNLPKGEQSVTGVLNRAPLSLTRRGTHVLSKDGERFTMVESASVSLDRYEGQTVTLKGTFEPNTDDTSLPVLVVTAIDVRQESYREEAVPSLGLTFSIPDDWKRDGADPTLSFSASGTTLLRLSVQPGTVIPAESNLSISSRLAQRTVDTKTGSGTIAVQLDNARILTLAFSPLAPDPVTALERLSQITRSLKFVTQQTSSGAATTGSGTSLPCGGEAGILCPKGSYCQITDGNVGRCRSL